ncbi:hypothetical protein [Aureliella helgolandensis]|uniref:Uncharacterized protein n=1 Tax=Aureliella helgolandensis TaxID=2527968 RepID=A0A518GGD3_9BACT|nr:hypothetical protein [Aureliella helgolandensis]QDV27661.1 hypothetical protein Q31a_60540 [Aureliella helgolandensis]
MSSVPGQVAPRIKPAPKASPQGVKQSASETARQQLHTHLRKTARFIKVLDSVALTFACIAGLLTLWLLACVLDHWLLPLPSILRWSFWIAAVGGTLWWFLRYLLPLLAQRINPTYAARRIEHIVPEFKNGLITWLELEATPDHGVPKGVVAALTYRAARFLVGHDPSATVDTSPLIKLVGVVLALMTVLVGYTIFSPKSPLTTGKRILMPWASLDAPTRVHILSVSPGNSELTQGKPLQVEVEVRGLRQQEKVFVRLTTNDQQIVDQRIPLDVATEGFRYTGRITTNSTGIEQELTYSIEAGDAHAGPYSVSLSPLPSVDLEMTELAFPAYTRLPNRMVSGGPIEAVEGTVATLRARANQVMRRGRIEVNPEVDQRGELVRAGAFIELDVVDRALTTDWLMRLNSTKDNPTRITFRLRGYNQHGDVNPQPLIHSMSVLADVPPEVQLLGPESRVLRVHPDARINLEVRAIDPDFGLTDLSIRSSINSSLPNTHTLLTGDGVVGRQVKTWRLDLQELGASEGDRLQIRAIALDNRHDPVTQRLAPNRAESEPLLIEVVGAQAPQDLTANHPNNADATKPSEAGEPSDGNDAPSNNGDSSNNSASGKTQPQPEAAQQDGRQESSDANSAEPNAAEPPENASGQPQENASAGGESNQEAAADSGGESSDSQDSGNQTGGGESSESGGSSSSGGESSGQPSQGQQEAGQTSSNNSGGNSSSEAQGSGNSSSAQGASTQDASSPGEPGKGSPASDQDAMQRIQEHIQQSQSPGESSSSSQSGAQQTGTEPPGSGQAAAEPSGSQQAGSDQSDPEKTGSKPSGSPQAGTEQSGTDQAGSQQQAGSEQSGSQQPGAEQPSSEQSGSQQSDAQPSDAEQAGSQQTGSEQTGSEQTGSEQSGSQQSGAEQSSSEQSSSQQPGSQQASPEQSGSEQSSSQQPSSAQTGSQQSSSQQTGSEQSGSEQSGSEQSGSEQSGSEQSSSQDSGSEQSGSQPSGSQPSGSQPSDSEQPGSQQAGAEQPSSERSGSQQSGSQPAGAEQSGSQKSGAEQSEAKQPSSQQSDSKQTGSQPAAGSEQSDSQQSGGQQESGKSNSQGQPGSSDSLSGESTGTSSSAAPGAGPESPNRAAEDAVDQQAAQQTTDMILDYLNRQKEQPDPELLRKLNWTPNDLQNFVDRWNAARELGTQGTPQDKLRWKEMLQDLQLDRSTQGQRAASTFNDTFQQMQDSGSRMRLPARLQKEYDLFRRVLETQSNSVR